MLKIVLSFISGSLFVKEPIVHLCKMIVVQLMFQFFAIFKSLGHFVQVSRTVCAILTGSIMGKLCVK